MHVATDMRGNNILSKRGFYTLYIGKKIRQRVTKIVQDKDASSYKRNNVDEVIYLLKTCFRSK